MSPALLRLFLAAALKREVPFLQFSPLLFFLKLRILALISLHLLCSHFIVWCLPHLLPFLGKMCKRPLNIVYMICISQQMAARKFHLKLNHAFLNLPKKNCRHTYDVIFYFFHYIFAYYYIFVVIFFFSTPKKNTCIQCKVRHVKTHFHNLDII